MSPMAGSREAHSSVGELLRGRAARPHQRRSRRPDVRDEGVSHAAVPATSATASPPQNASQRHPALGVSEVVSKARGAAAGIAPLKSRAKRGSP